LTFAAVGPSSLLARARLSISVVRACRRPRRT
jgi:hypothetical protein